MNDWKCSLQEALSRRREKEFPQFLSIAKNLVSATMKTLEGGDSNSFSGEPDRKKIYSPLTESNIVGSQIWGTESPYNAAFPDDFELHKPVLDIDLPCWLKESTTPGHFHLIIDKEMSWSEYKRLLRVMCDVGILEDGFVAAAISRKASWIRTPWTQKITGENAKEQVAIALSDQPSVDDDWS